MSYLLLSRLLTPALMIALSKAVLLLAGLLGLAYGLVCGWLYLRQTHMIFFPTPTIESTPAEFGLPYESLRVPIAGRPSESLQGWWIPAENPNAPVVLHLHGNSVNIGANVFQAACFHQLGLSVLLMDYRGYGQSQGNFPHETQVYEDAEVMWQYLTQTRRIPPDQIMLYGHSLGGAIAIELALHHPDAAGLIVESSFTSIRDMIASTTNLNFFPVDWLLTQRFASLDKVPHLQLPILLIHGQVDTRTPFTMTETLYRAAPHPKQLYLVPAAGHNDVAEQGGTEYLRKLREFIQTLGWVAHHPTQDFKWPG